MKKLFLIFQGKDESISEYTKTFNALLGIAKLAGVAQGWYKVTAKIAYKASRKYLTDWDALKNIADATDKTEVEEYREEDQK